MHNFTFKVHILWGRKEKAEKSTSFGDVVYISY